MSSLLMTEKPYQARKQWFEIQVDYTIAAGSDGQKKIDLATERDQAPKKIGEGVTVSEDQDL